MKSLISKVAILNRLKKVANSSSEADLARFLGVAPATLSNWKSRDSIDYDLVFSKCVEVNLDWLLTGKGAMFNPTDIQLADTRIAERFSLRTDRTLKSQNVPLYELDATAGLVELFDRSNQSIPANYIQIPDLPPCDGGVYVRGDSMYPLLKSGDIVLYKEVHNFANILWGEMYLLSFNLDGESYITVKYIQKSDDPTQIRLVSHNSHHSPMDIPSNTIKALAIIKASVRFNTMG